MPHPELAKAFAAALGQASDPSLLDALERCLATARAEHPSLLVEVESFAGALARGVRSAEPLAWLERVRAADLYLAVAAGALDAAALAKVDRAIAPEAERAAQRSRVAGLDADDLKQVIRQRLFVAEPGRAPKICEYIGEGDLRGWVRVIAVRALVDVARKRSGGEEAAANERAVDLMFGVDPGPELAYLKQRYRADFSNAFTEAIAALAAEDRTALRQHFVDRLSIDQLATAHGIHRATAARRVQKARESLLSDTRMRLMGRLKMSRGELESVMRLIESQLHVSVVRLLG